MRIVGGQFEGWDLTSPNDSRVLDRVIEGWRRTRFSTLLVAEHATTHALPAGAELRRFGETSVSFDGLRAASRPARASPGA